MPLWSGEAGEAGWRENDYGGRLQLQHKAAANQGFLTLTCLEEFTVCLFVCLYICLPVCLQPTCMSLCLFSCLPFYMAVILPTCLAVCLSAFTLAPTLRQHKA